MREQGCIVTMVSISENGNGDIAGVPMTKVFTQMVERENVIKYLLECLIKIIFLTKCLIKIILTMKVKKPKFYNKPQTGEIFFWTTYSRSVQTLNHYYCCAHNTHYITSKQTLKLIIDEKEKYLLPRIKTNTIVVIRVNVILKIK